MNASKQRIVLVASAVVGLTLAATTAYAAIGGPATVRSDPPSTRVEPAARPVSAAEYWEASRQALSCASEQGASVVGPLPSPDGASITYALQVGEDTARIEDMCMAPLQPIAFRFALDNGPPVDLEQPGDAEKRGAPSAQPATKEAAALAAIRSGIASCLRDRKVVVDESDGELARAMHDEVAEFAACVASV